jgi:uncharacterized protein
MTTNKRIILTGATGLIGRKLYAALQQQGYEVTVFSRSPERARAALPGAADYVAWSPGPVGPWASALEGAYGVVHLAGAAISEGLIGPRWTDEYKAEILNSRVLGTRGLVEAIGGLANKPAVFACASAVGYYGYRDATPLDERAPPGSDFVAEVCVAWENEAARVEEFGVRRVSVRTGLLLDPEAGVLPQIMLPFKLFTGGPVQPGTQYYSWIHPADEIALWLLALADERASGPLNATAPTPQTNREFSATLGKVLNSPSWLTVPEFSLRIALGEMADLVTKGQRVLPKKALELGYQFKFSELEAALRDLLGK